MFCKTCGNQLNNGDIHCSKCGAIVSNNNESAANNSANMNNVNSANDFGGVNPTNIMSNVNTNNQSSINNVPNSVNNSATISTNNYTSYNIPKNTKKPLSFVKIYLMMAGGSVAFFFIFTIISLVMRMNSSNPDNYTAPAIINLFQTTIPILLLVFGWVPAMLLSSKNQQVNNINSNTQSNYNNLATAVPKKRTGLKIVLGVIGGLLALFIIIGVIGVITSKKYECKSSQGNLTIMYRDDEIIGHTAKNIEFDSDAADEFVKQYGLDEYLKYLKTVFEAQTDGTCEYK